MKALYEMFEEASMGSCSSGYFGVVACSEGRAPRYRVIPGVGQSLSFYLRERKCNLNLASREGERERGTEGESKRERGVRRKCIY